MTSRLRPLMPIGLVGLLLAATLAAAPGASAAVGAPGAAMMLQNVTLEDLTANRHGICSGNFTHVMKNAASQANATNFLNAAQGCGLQVILHFPETANHATGVVYPARVAAWVRPVRNHPALWGYLTVKEPSWNRITAFEIRSLYRAFKAADPNHPVMAMFGDIPHFGQSVNPYTGGMADVLIVNWYPVETANLGRLASGTSYLTSGPSHFRKVRAFVASKTPNLPVWLMVGTHRYLRPAAHKKQRPSESLLRRQVREGFVHLGAAGIGFHSWSNTNYSIDQRRDATMVGWMNKLAGQVQAGTFE